MTQSGTPSNLFNENALSGEVVPWYPFEVPFDIEGIQGAVLSDQIRSLDWKSRNAQYIAHLPQEVVIDVLARLQVLL